MKIPYINNDGGGFADHIEVEEGTTVQVLFRQRVGSGKPSDYRIRALLAAYSTVSMGELLMQRLRLSSTDRPQLFFHFRFRRIVFVGDRLFLAACRTAFPGRSWDSDGFGRPSYRPTA